MKTLPMIAPHSPRRLSIGNGIWLDARRAVWIEPERTVAVADLHLGYAWVHRHGGQMLPITPDEILPRLIALIEEYQPDRVVLLGDVVHRAVSVPDLCRELTATIRALRERCSVTLVAGNHDRNLGRLLVECELDLPLVPHCWVGPHLLAHGDDAARALAEWENPERTTRGRIIIGHEHPAITLGDGAVTSAKCACFAMTDTLLMLPAFSRWAAGSDVRTHARGSPWLSEMGAVTAVAILGDKLLSVPLH